MVFDTGSDKDRHALARLGTDRIAWLTTVTPDGQPQTFPIWFLWDGATALVYGDNRAKRNANLATNPRVSLHLADDGGGNDIVVIEGTAQVDAGAPPLTENAAYLARYADWIAEMGWTPESMAERYDTRIRVTPVRGRASGPSATTGA